MVLIPISHPLQNTDNKKHLQPHYIPFLFSTGSIKPVPITLISAMDGGMGTSLLERMGKALGLFREGRVSGSKIIVQVGDGA